MQPSPYLGEGTRLADVIAAIQAMSTYKFYKLSFAQWADRITGSDGSATHWERVFREHPEFFRLDSGETRASLIWRRQHPKRYSVDEMRTITRAEFYALSDERKKRVSRTPLASDELGLLISTAIDLHERALARRQDARWWVPTATALVGVVLGAILHWIFTRVGVGG